MKFALIGEKLSHSYSPFIHNLFFEKNQINASYELIELKKDKLEEFCNEVKEGKLQGFNITIPYKQDIFSFVDEIDSKARSIGAINTVKNLNGKLFAYNTDYYGYLYSLKKIGIDIKGKKVIVLGNGGSAKAIIEVLKDLEAKEIYLVSRNKNKDVPESVISISYEELETVGKAELITNCTPVGMYPNEENCPINKELFKYYKYAVDLIYNPKETKFLKFAKENNLKVLNGLYMLLGQALKAEEIWQNLEISMNDVDEIYTELEKNLYGG